jgi:hypothetical protein
MKQIKIYFSVFLFVLLAQNTIGQYVYTPGKEYTIRSKVKAGLTCVTKIVIDTNMVAKITFSQEKSLADDKAYYVILAPEGEISAKLSSNKNEVQFRMTKPGSKYFYINYGTKKGYSVEKFASVEGSGLQKLVDLGKLRISVEISDVSQLVISSDQPGDLHSFLPRNGDLLEFASPGILFKANRVVFE